MKELSQLSKTENIILQLGISALIMIVFGFIFYKVAVLLINKWSERDAARTKEIGDGFRAMTTGLSEVVETLNENQISIADHIYNLRVEVNHLNQKVAQANDFTPVKGIPLVRPPMPLVRAPVPSDEHITPHDRPSLLAAKRVPTAGEYSHTPTKTPPKGIKKA